jgi:hypothetical protein
LVVSNICFSIIYGMSSFPLTFIFFKKVATTNQCWLVHLELRILTQIWLVWLVVPQPAWGAMGIVTRWSLLWPFVAHQNTTTKIGDDPWGWRWYLNSFAVRLYHFWNFVKSSVGKLSRPDPRVEVWSCGGKQRFQVFTCPIDHESWFMVLMILYFQAIWSWKNTIICICM